MLYDTQAMNLKIDNKITSGNVILYLMEQPFKEWHENWKWGTIFPRPWMVQEVGSWM